MTSWPNGGLEEQIANGSAWRLDPGERLTSEIRLSAYRSRTGVVDVGPDGAVHTAN